MPRTARASVGGICYHVLNRGNGHAVVFHKPGDYAAFVDLIDAACTRDPMRVPAYCLMPNHFHLVLWPHADGDLSRWMQWLLTAHVRRYHSHHGTSGHVWQGRFKAFPIEQDEHLLTVLRYVERNPLRAKLVRRAWRYPWSSAAAHCGQRDPSGLLDPRRWQKLPEEQDWKDVLSRPEDDEAVGLVRLNTSRGRPLGSDSFISKLEHKLGRRLRPLPVGRPKKKISKTKKR